MKLTQEQLAAASATPLVRAALPKATKARERAKAKVRAATPPLPLSSSLRCWTL